MKKWNKKERMFVSLWFTAILLVASWLPLSISDSGAASHQEADLSRLVVVGDSLSAGFQNGSLLGSQQVNGYASLLANQAGVDLPLPLIAAPGIPARFLFPVPVVSVMAGIVTVLVG